jgi:hypothetical protein
MYELKDMSCLPLLKLLGALKIAVQFSYVAPGSVHLRFGGAANSNYGIATTTLGGFRELGYAAWRGLRLESEEGFGS